MTTKVNLLDHGFVRLVSYMQPVPKVSLHPVDPFANPTKIEERRTIDPDWTGDLEIVRNARASFDADWRTGENEFNDERLIGTLTRNGHTSPFEAMVFTFEIKCPIFIARQWHRHRTWSYNEVSARYAELPEEYYVPRPEHIGVQSKSNKQARELGEVDKLTSEAIAGFSKTAFELYRAMLEKGVPRELARTVLPFATYTRFFGTVDLHNLFHFITLRTHEHAQWEIQRYAHALVHLIRPIVPVAVAAFEREQMKREDSNG